MTAIPLCVKLCIAWYQVQITAYSALHWWDTLEEINSWSRIGETCNWFRGVGSVVGSRCLVVRLDGSKCSKLVMLLLISRYWKCPTISKKLDSRQTNNWNPSGRTTGKSCWSLATLGWELRLTKLLAAHEQTIHEKIGYVFLLIEPTVKDLNNLVQQHWYHNSIFATTHLPLNWFGLGVCLN